MPQRGRITAEFLEGYPDDPDLFLAGQVESDGSNKWLTPAGAGGGGGGMTLLETQTPSGVSESDFTSCISSLYDSYEIQVIGLTVSTSNTSLVLQVHANGSYQTSGYNSGLLAIRDDASGAPGISTTGGIYLSNALNGAAGYSWSGSIRMFGPENTALNRLFTVSGYGRGSDGFFYQYQGGGSWNDTTNAVDGFRIKPGAGNISGIIRIYGIEK